MELDMSGATVAGGWGIGQAGSLYASRATIAGTLSNSGLLELGLVNPPGSQSYADTLTITGDYAQSGSGRLGMDVLTYPTWLVDHLTVSGNASFGGTFTLRVPYGLPGGPGMSISLIDYQTRGGAFASCVLPSPWGPEYQDNPPNGPGMFLIRYPYGPPYP